MTPQELKQQIEKFPSEYIEALKEQTQAILFYEELERELSYVEKKRSLELEEVHEAIYDEDSDIELIKLEAVLEQLKLKASEIEFKAEVEFRKSHDKTTESHVKAEISQNTQVAQVRRELIDAKAGLRLKKAEHLRERSERRDRERQKRFEARIEIENDEIKELQARLASARQRYLMANDQVEFLRKQLAVFEMLMEFDERPDE